MESQIVITEVKTTLTLTVSEMVKLKKYLEGAQQMSGYLSGSLEEDIIEFANDFDELVGKALNSIG